jgi:hypothetical protein
MIPDENSELYSHVELDEFGGALLLHGALQSSMSHLMDALSDPQDLLLIEMTNHAPDGMAATVLTATAVAAKQVKLLMEAIIKASDCALASLVDRMETDKQRVLDAFNELVKDLDPGEEATEG